MGAVSRVPQALHDVPERVAGAERRVPAPPPPRVVVDRAVRSPGAGDVLVNRVRPIQRLKQRVEGRFGVLGGPCRFQSGERLGEAADHQSPSNTRSVELGHLGQG
jgi:hypothetical protein